MLKGISADDRHKVITLLADVENHAAYPDFQKMADELKANHEVELPKEFELAREKGDDGATNKKLPCYIS